MNECWDNNGDARYLDRVSRYNVRFVFLRSVIKYASTEQNQAKKSIIIFIITFGHQGGLTFFYPMLFF